MTYLSGRCHVELCAQGTMGKCSLLTRGGAAAEFKMSAPTEQSPDENVPEKRPHSPENDGDDIDDDDGWIGPMPSEAAKPKKRKGESVVAINFTIALKLPSYRSQALAHRLGPIVHKALPV